MKKNCIVLQRKRHNFFLFIFFLFLVLSQEIMGKGKIFVNALLSAALIAYLYKKYQKKIGVPSSSKSVNVGNSVDSSDNTVIVPKNARIKKLPFYKNKNKNGKKKNFYNADKNIQKKSLEDKQYQNKPKKIENSDSEVRNVKNQEMLDENNVMHVFSEDNDGKNKLKKKIINYLEKRGDEYILIGRSKFEKFFFQIIETSGLYGMIFSIERVNPVFFTIKQDKLSVSSNDEKLKYQLKNYDGRFLFEKRWAFTYDKEVELLNFDSLSCICKVYRKIENGRLKIEKIDIKEGSLEGDKVESIFVDLPQENEKKDIANPFFENKFSDQGDSGSSKDKKAFQIDQNAKKDN